jgi:hypothetical protein
MSRLARLGLVASLLVLAGTIPLAAQEVADRFALGVRGVITVADGTPANDIPGAGLFGRYRLGERWRLGLAFDQTEYDFEQPARILGLQQDPALDPIDVLATADTLSVWVERTHGADGPWTWFWGGGVGYSSVDVPVASGPLAGGGRFDVHTDAGDELIASALAGVDRRLGRRFFLQLALRADQHFADWKVVDRVSGRQAAVDDYLAYGGSVGLGFRF